jgi:hypothetical protein
MFYLTLPSNSSQQFYPENTLTHFTTQLAHAVDLEGQWEVGLVEIQYPHTWHNMKDGWIRIKSNSDLITLKLPTGQYDTPEQLIGGLNQMIEQRQTYAVKTYETVIHTEISTLNLATAEFFYHNVTKRASVKISKGSWIELSPTLMKMLGMTHTHLTEGYHEAAHVVDVDQGFHSLYIYCSVVEARPVGDSEVPLLRIVPIEGKSGQMITKTYENIQYIPVLCKHFRTIEVDIKKDTGERVPFELGKVVVTLHFRKRRPIL